jgi:predicted dehydrogenase
MQPSSLSSPPHPRPGIVNWLVVGLGDVALKRVLPALTAEPRSCIYGVVTKDPVKGRRHAEHVWSALDQALEDPAIDAVYVATPVFLHCPQTVAALHAGKHVLCEKPASLDDAEARQMTEAAERSGTQLGIAYFRRYYPKLRRAKQLLEQRAVGTPVVAFAHCSEWFHNEDGARDWLLDPRRAGSGPLYDIGSHRIDAMNFLFGRPNRVSAELSNVIHSTAVEDAATVLMEYPTGVRAMIDARWNTRTNRDDFRIEGTDGEIDLSPLNGPLLRSPLAEEMLPCAANRHYPCVENFVDAILNHAPLACAGADVLSTAWALEQALRKGRPPAGAPNV